MVIYRVGAILIKLLLFLTTVFAGENFEQLKGKTFTYPGPNCFGVALYAAGINPIIRGVDLSEFKAVLKHQCSKTEDPLKGDIGVYSMENFDIIHAYYNYGEDTVLEKTGVDYLGEVTPIHIRDKSNSYHTFGYSKECVHYGGKDNPACYNTLEYYRCSDLEAETPTQITSIETSIDQILEEILNDKAIDYKKLFNRLHDLILDYESIIEQYGDGLDEILRARLKSYQLQFKFLPKPDSKKDLVS